MKNRFSTYVYNHIDKCVFSNLDIDVQCDFEEEDFLCGYLNFTQWSMGNEWMVVSYNSKIDTATLNVEAGKVYLHA